MLRRSSGRRDHGNLEDAGVQALGTTPSVLNLANLEAEEFMLDELRARAGLMPRGQEAPHPPLSREASDALYAATGLRGETTGREIPPLFAIAMPLIRMGMMNVVDDSFSRCFKSQKKVPWNWNMYLWPAWVMGVLVRYLLLLPLRCLALLLGFLTVGTVFPFVKLMSLCLDTKHIEIA